MTTRMTLFTSTLVQDSALSVAGIDRESSADRPFALVDGVPILSGRGLKGAAVAMARRFFERLPPSVSEDPLRKFGYRRSAWEFANATPGESGTILNIRAGVGIRQKTGARAGGVLYAQEVVPAGTRWPLVFRIDWSHAGEEAEEAEGILGYVLARHWAKGRCWLGGGVARGLGWCHIEDLFAYRLDAADYDRWVESDRKVLPDALPDAPTVEPTRSWCFRTLDLKLTFGEYHPVENGLSWGLDMFAVGPHDTEQATQVAGDGVWARPSWSSADDSIPDAFSTDRALLMEGERPLLPGSSIRGPLRHAFSRARNATGQTVQDPHQLQGKVKPDDPGGQVFGSVEKSSRILIRDARAEAGWAAARLHMHAEDEFTAGSYGSAKREAVRLLNGTFPIRIVVEGPSVDIVDPLVTEIDRLIALGEVGHLPLGGHKTRGAGWGQWQPESWVVDDIACVRTWEPPVEKITDQAAGGMEWTNWRDSSGETTHVRMTNGVLDISTPMLGKMAAEARRAFGTHKLVAWWYEPAIDLTLTEPPPTYGRQWPDRENFQVDEVTFFAKHAVWRAAETVAGMKWVFIEEQQNEFEPDTMEANIIHTPARLHDSSRFTAAKTGKGQVLLREWHVDGQRLGFTVEETD